MISDKKSIESVVSDKKFPPVMHGLDGICELFGVCKTKAWSLKNTILKDAITQNGRIIIMDTKKALMLFGMDKDDAERVVSEVSMQ
ncbi:MAG: DUF3853 family protein [Bacteroidales bacterium]|nr:DUF3853 family protein [Bacteroidales bacterium]